MKIETAALSYSSKCPEAANHHSSASVLHSWFEMFVNKGCLVFFIMMCTANKNFIHIARYTTEVNQSTAQKNKNTM